MISDPTTAMTHVKRVAKIWLVMAPGLPASNFRVEAVEVIDPVVAAWDLGRGESEVLTCAASVHADAAVLDDRSARRCATALGLATHGTLHVLLKAKEAGLLPSVAPMIERARAEGLFLSDALVAKVLVLAGEKP